ncbi:MAG TPA: DUF1801 domain-containing protein [Candidatus Limnocylindrales bacterium]|jgi:hypothetical protein
MTVDGDVDRLLEPHAEPIAEVARAVRSVIRSEMPEANESVDFGNRLIAFGWSMRIRDLLFAVIPHTAHVNLQLADGAELPDPTGIIEGTGKRIRHVKLRAPEDVEKPQIRALVRAQLERRPPS